ncbi:MAG: hypothetical protein ACP5N2_06385 [Candidatus Nanoarchaeia archaeon]
MVKKRGQAALEFLTTYGWAFMLILVMIGAIDYFNILNPGRLISEKCLMSSGIYCKDYTVNINPGGYDDSFIFLFQNNLGEHIIVNEVKISGPPGSGIYDYVNSYPDGNAICRRGNPPTRLAPDESAEFYVPCYNDFIGKNKKTNAEITISYRPLNGKAAFDREIRGNLVVDIPPESDITSPPPIDRANGIIDDYEVCDFYDPQDAMCDHDGYGLRYINFIAKPDSECVGMFACSVFGNDCVSQEECCGPNLDCDDGI